MTEKRYSLGSLAALFMALFFSFIVLYYLFAFIKITRYDVFPAVVVFTVINLILIVILTVGSLALIKKIGGALFAAICTATAIYSVFQFVYMGLRYDHVSAEGYILYHLIILFLYFMVVIPIGIIGIKNK